ncbi:MAG: SAM-dependent methyltransferase [Ruminococcaceae bacterium]|nr:SAM-dependent methyltransferase [Oscillospiraceae bacterium]
MRLANRWKDYELLDASGGERLERWGDITLIRPDPQIIWNTPRSHPMWNRADARYCRSKSGGGSWDIRRKLPQSWSIRYDDLTFAVKPMGFKHTGLFPEQAVNWDWMRQRISGAGRPIRVLNLFAYTGGATLACLAGGAQVCHVDASKGMTAWAKENAAVSGMPADKQRWIVEDCAKFVAREERRGSLYDAIIMDPPSYGRGPGGEVWKLEEQIYDLVGNVAKVLSKQPLFFIINSYTTGLSPSVMKYILSCHLGARWKNAEITADEIGLPVTQSGLALPCGATAIFSL